MAEPIMTPDAELAFLLKKGDERAFTDLYNKYSSPLYANILHLCRDKELAKELLQDTFVKLWEQKSLVDPEQSVRSYLFRIAENLLYDHFRRLAHDRKLKAALLAESTEEQPTLEDILLNKETRQQIQQAVGQLPEQRRHVYTLCKLEGRSYKEVSMLLGISTATISDHIVKANKFLKNHLGDKSDTLTLLLIAAALWWH